MKKVLCIASILGLAACSNPEVARPFGYGSPTYYKVPECRTVRDYPQSYRSWDPVAGRYDTYITTQNTTHVECNHNPLMRQPVQSLNSVYLYGGSR